MVQGLTPESIRARRALAESELVKLREKIAQNEQIISDSIAAERFLAAVSVGNGDAPNLPPPADIKQSESLKAIELKSEGKQPYFFGGGDDSPVNPFRKNTVKSRIWAILMHSDNPWLSANEIQAKLEEVMNTTVPMTSISPLLSGMKDEYIVRDNLKVALKSRVESKNPAAETAGS